MRLADQIVRTPLLAYRTSDADLSGRIFLKPENLQPFGAYKIRGVASLVAHSPPSLLQQGLHTLSAGNMAQPVAFAAKTLGVPCRIYVPNSAPEAKKAAIRALGAELREVPFDVAWASVRGDVVLESSGVFIHPTRTEAQWMGYGSIAEEIVDDLPDVDAIMIPFGVGGLALGIARAMARLRPQTSLFTVEPESSAPMKASLAAGAACAVARQPSFVDAIGTPEVLPDVFDALAPVLAGSEAVPLNAARQALASLFRRHKLVVEGAAACALAAAEQLARRTAHQRIVCILSGGNIDEDTLQKILSETPSGRRDDLGPAIQPSDSLSPLINRAHAASTMNRDPNDWPPDPMPRPTPIGAFTDRSWTYLAEIERRVLSTRPAAIADRIDELVAGQDAWRSRCLNLNPAETLMSRRTRALLDSDMATRLTEGVPGDKLYPHGRLNEAIDEIEATIIALARIQFGAAYVEWRPTSTTMANAAVFHALMRPGDVMISQDEDGGGNYAYQRSGPAGLVASEVLPIPRKGQAFEFDLDALEALADARQPRMIVIGGSNLLFPYPLKEIRRIADRVGAYVLYDAAHVGLLISRGDLQRPLEEGAHVVTLSTAKIMGGPVGGLVLTNDPAIADLVVRLTFPTLLQTRDLNKLNALALSLAETAAFGAARARQTVANAQALGRRLSAEGFEVLAAERGYTRTHQIFLELGDEAKTFETRCNEANIMLTDCALTGDMARGRRSGSRLGTHEVTRLGMQEAEMAEIARLIRRAFEGEPAEAVAADVQQLLSRHQQIAYSFDHGR